MAQRQKTPHVVVSFDTLFDAVAFEVASRIHDIPGRTIPVPPQIDAGCGTAWAAPLTARLELEEAMATYQLDCTGVHELMLY